MRQDGVSQLSYSNGAAYGEPDNDGISPASKPIIITCFVYRNNANKLQRIISLKVKFKGPDKNLFELVLKQIKIKMA